MAASALASAAEFAGVISNATAYKIRKELVSGYFLSGGVMDETTKSAKRLQLAAWESARSGKTMVYPNGAAS